MHAKLYRRRCVEKTACSVLGVSAPARFHSSTHRFWACTPRSAHNCSRSPRLLLETAKKHVKICRRPLTGPGICGLLQADVFALRTFLNFFTSIYVMADFSSFRACSCCAFERISLNQKKTQVNTTLALDSNRQCPKVALSPSFGGLATLAPFLLLAYRNAVYRYCQSKGSSSPGV